MPRILVIDDDAAVREVLRRMLTSAGYDVDEAPDGRIAVELYSRQPSDVVITDLEMPGQDGLKTIPALRDRDAGVRIIAISGGGFVGAGVEDALESARLLGAMRTIAKPFSKQEILTAVEEVLADPS